MLKQAQSNKDIREAAASAGVFLWQVAEAIGVTDGTFSRKLRRELPDDDKAAILQIIQLSTYMESKGKRYNNHAATLRNWAARDKSRQKPPRSGGLPDYSYKDGESL